MSRPEEQRNRNRAGRGERQQNHLKAVEDFLVETHKNILTIIVLVHSLKQGRLITPEFQTVSFGSIQALCSLSVPFKIKSSFRTILSKYQCIYLCST